MDGLATTEIQFLEWAVGLVGAGLLLIAGWIWSKVITSMEKLRVDLDNHEKSLTDYKLEAEKRFAKDVEVSDKFGKLDGNIATIQSDIQKISISMATLAAVAQVKINAQGVS